VICRARWILPIDRPPIENGWIRLEGGIIQAVGSGTPRDPGVTDLGDAVVLPGLINAHTHLELSWMAGRVPPAPSMGAWIRGLVTLRREASPSDDAQRAAATAALAEARVQGTRAFGDISNTLLTAQVLADTHTPAVLFHELFGFGLHDADRHATEGAERVVTTVRPPVRAGLASHAPYSVSPDLFRAVTREAATRGLPSSVHLAESPEEVEFLKTGRGEIAETLKSLGVWNEAWLAPKVDPVAYLEGLGVLQPGLLIVHATQLGSAALARLAERGCVIVSCPRSNRWVGAGDPPLDAFYASGALVAFGTDSLASAPDLNMFAELAAARAVSAAPARKLLESATRGGAMALGLGDRFGTIEPGKRADLIAVRIPANVPDVEEYLVSGIQPSDVRWL
jgi:aminodeoxyfutalosine deaminase